MADGLPQNTVTAILQTRDGYIWIGTRGGVARFDGVRFTVFDKRNSPEFSNDYILSLFEDREGKLWIGTNGGEGLFCYSGNRIHSGLNGMKRMSSGVYAILQDRSGDLWVGTGGGGLNRLSGTTWTSFGVQNGLPSDTIVALALDKEGRLCIGTGGGGTFCRMEDEGHFRQFSVRNGLSHREVRSIQLLHDGHLCLGTYGGGPVVLKGNRFLPLGASGPLGRSMVRSVLEDRDGNIWIGTRGDGLYRLNSRGLSRLPVREGGGNDTIFCLHEDREGNLWVGTARGLLRLKNSFFSVYTVADGLAGSIVFSVYEDRNGSIWIGTNKGLTCLKNHETVSYSIKEGLPANDIRSIGEDRDGRLWVGSYGGGIAFFQKGRFVPFGRADRVLGDYIFAQCEGGDSGFWIGAKERGLIRLQKGRTTVFSDRDGFRSKSVTVILKDGENLWIGTADNGLYRFHDGTFTQWTNKQGLSSNSVLSLHFDHKGILWVGTNSGLNRFTGGRIRTIAMMNGLVDDFIYSIIEDESNRLWMSSNRGIFYLEPEILDDFIQGHRSKVVCRSFGVAEGLLNPECNGGQQPAGWRCRNGRLWFSTMEGAAMIDPSRIDTNELVPPVRIEKLVSDRKIVNADAVSSPVLEAGTRMIEFQYTGLSFQMPGKVLFRFKLDGFDPDWIDAGTRRSAFYTRIPPGEYVFRVIACNNDGLWNERGASIRFTLLPHFFQRAVFYFLCGFILLAFVIGFHLLRVVRLKRKTAELKQIVADQTETLWRTNEQLAEKNIRLAEKTNQLEEAYGKVEMLSRLDGLTGIANRRFFDEFMDREWKRAMRGKDPVSLIMIDVDFFKAFNDQYGHPAGDACLRKVAWALHPVVNRPGDLLARYGGEEFIVALSETGKEGAVVVAERMRERIWELGISHRASPVEGRISISLGVATILPESTTRFDHLMRAADRALYRAKTEGRNRVCAARAEDFDPVT